MKKIFKKISAVFTAATIIAMLTFAIEAPVSAASFSGGNGTKSNPYIVTTAAQLQSIGTSAANLKAHYKLGATIDLSGIDWKPIGTWAKSKGGYFSGSFTCDVGSENVPLYAIKNLTCKVTPPNIDAGDDYRYKDYKADGSSGWEAGLFGVCYNASFSNIVITGATVNNRCRGRSMQEKYQGATVNNPADQMCAGILAGAVAKTTVTNCAVYGKLNGSTNYVGGLIGNATCGSSIKNSYAVVDINTENASLAVNGWWGTGGLLGALNQSSSDWNKYFGVKNETKASTVDSCFAQGTVLGGYCGTGGLIGSVEKICKVSNVYTSGYVNADELTFSVIGEEVRTTVGTTKDVLTNAYTLMGCCQKTAPATLKRGDKTNCYMSVEPSANGKYPFQDCFSAADKATINSAFSKLTDKWTVNGTGYPQLKNVVIIPDINRYAVGQSYGTAKKTGSNNAGTAGNNAGTSAGDTDNTDTTENGTTETGSDNNAKNKIETVVYDKSGKMTGSEKILVIVLLCIMGLCLAGSITIVVMSFITVHKFKAKAASAGAETENNPEIIDITNIDQN